MVLQVDNISAMIDKNYILITHNDFHDMMNFILSNVIIFFFLVLYTAAPPAKLFRARLMHDRIHERPHFGKKNDCTVRRHWDSTLNKELKEKRLVRVRRNRLQKCARQTDD